MTTISTLSRSLRALYIKPTPAASLLFPSASSCSSPTTIVTRTKMTKTKKSRLLKKSNPQPKKLPPNYIDPKTPIKLSPTVNRPSLSRPPVEERLSHYLPLRSKILSEETPPLRYNFTNLENEMSPKLKKLFHLTNASTNEMAKAQKQKAMELFQMRPGDTGSSAVQIIALTNRIQQVQNHVGIHKKDHSGKRGLNALYVKRRKMLDYLERKDYDTYRTVVSALGLVR